MKEVEVKALIHVGFPSPPSFSVLDYVDYKRQTGYVNSRDFMFDELVEELPVVLRKFSNDITAKAMLSHRWGEFLSKDFREWIRAQIDWSGELEDGGASIENEEAVAWK